MENSLPKGWSAIKLNDLCNLVYGKGLLTKELSENGYPVFGANGVIGHYSKYTYAEPKVIISCRGAASGAIHLTQPKSFVTSNSIVLDMITEEISNDYLKYAMLSIDRTQIVTGTAQPQITIENLKDLEIPLPALAEQHRIVAKLDALLARVATCKNRLEKIPGLLKNFRQSVLAAAVSGELTKEWRENEDLIETTISNKEIKYPIQWAVDVFENCIHELRNGVSKKPNQSPPGTKVLRISSVRSGNVDFSGYRFYNELESIEKYLLKNEDLLFTRYNGSIDLLGVCGMVRNLNQEFIYPDKLMRVRLKEEKLVPAYVEIYYQVGFAREDVLKNAKSSAGQNGISGKDLKETKILLPPIEEQKEIVRKVEELFHFADSIEARYQKAKAWFDKLPQAILAKAFRGELVEQDENDEPASVLLERIKKEKTTLRQAQGDKKQTNKPKPTAKRKKVYEENEGVSLAAEE